MMKPEERVISHGGHGHPARELLRPYLRPGLLVTATGTDVGKTVVTAALAGAFRQLGVHVGVCKPVASGCPRRGREVGREGLTDEDYVSPDAELLALGAGLDATDETLMGNMAPVRFGAAVSPHIAAQLEGRRTNWKKVATALDYWAENSEVLLVEGAGGWLVPLDEHDFMVADLAAALRLPVLVVTDAVLGTLNVTHLTVQAIQQRGLAVAGLVINHVPAEMGLTAESNLRELPRLCGVPVRAVLRQMEGSLGGNIPGEFIEALVPFAREWWKMAGGEESMRG